MLGRFVLIGSLVAGLQAFAPAPIRWGGIPGKELFLAPRSLPNRPLVLPLTLMLSDRSGTMSPEEIPYFVMKLDNTISWGDDLCLEAAGDTIGDVIRVNRCTGEPTQLWESVPWSHGEKNRFRLKGSDKCIDVKDEGGLNEASVDLRDCDINRMAEAWSFESIPLPTQGGPVQHTASSFSKQGVVRSSCISMAGLVVFSLGIWLLRRLKTTRTLPVRHRCEISGSEFSGAHNVCQGGISLCAHPTAHQGNAPLNLAPARARVLLAIDLDARRGEEAFERAYFKWHRWMLARGRYNAGEIEYREKLQIWRDLECWGDELPPYRVIPKIIPTTTRPIETYHLGIRSMLKSSWTDKEFYHAEVVVQHPGAASTMHDLMWSPNVLQEVARLRGYEYRHISDSTSNKKLAEETVRFLQNHGVDFADPTWGHYEDSPFNTKHMNLRTLFKYYEQLPQYLADVLLSDLPPPEQKMRSFGPWIPPFEQLGVEAPIKIWTSHWGPVPLSYFEGEVTSLGEKNIGF